jgi:hypothetical protein
MNKLFKTTLLLLIFCISFNAHAQLDKLDSLLQAQNIPDYDIAFSKTNLTSYPRGFVYNLNNKDSVLYFGCFSSDVEDVKKYINTNKSVFLLEVNKELIRQAGPSYSDTIKMLPLSEFLNVIETGKVIDEKIKHPKTQYIIFYYWRASMWRVYEKNILSFRKMEKKSKHQIVFVPVSTDNFVKPKKEKTQNN